MNIWVLEIGEPLPLEKGVRLHRYGQFTRYLADQGHQVTWWTSSFSHAPKVHLVDQDTEILESGLRLKVIKGLGYSRNVSLARIKHQKDFATKFLEYASRETKPDLILAPVPTIEGAFAAVSWARENKIPVFVDVRDLWPDELVDIAPAPARPILRFAVRGLYKKMSFLCKNATGVIGVSPRYLNYGLKFAERELGKKDHIFPLGYSKSKASARGAMPPKILELNLNPDRFIVSFIGTIGKFFDLETVVKVARRFHSEGKQVDFVLAGAGSGLESVKEQAKGLPNVYFPGWLKEDEIESLLKLSAVGLAPYKSDAKMEMPNKPYEYMSRGLPLLSSLKGSLEELIDKEELGLNYTADDENDLYAKVLILMQNQEHSKQMGKNALSLFEARFSTEVVFKQAEQFLSRVLD